MNTREHSREIAQRMWQAYDGMVASLMEFGEITNDQAIIVADFYIKEKLVVRDLWAGRYTVKHGVYWDKEVIRRAYVMATEGTKL